MYTVITSPFLKNLSTGKSQKQTQTISKQWFYVGLTLQKMWGFFSLCFSVFLTIIDKANMKKNTAPQEVK